MSDEKTKPMVDRLRERAKRCLGCKKVWVTPEELLELCGAPQTKTPTTLSCWPSPYSSRVCERGTCGCNVKHEAVAPPQAAPTTSIETGPIITPVRDVGKSDKTPRIFKNDAEAVAAIIKQVREECNCYKATRLHHLPDCPAHFKSGVAPQAEAPTLTHVHEVLKIVDEENIPLMVGAAEAPKPDHDNPELVYLCRGHEVGYVPESACELCALREMRSERLAAAPSVTGDFIEICAQRVHEAYLETCAKLGWSVKPENAVPYSELSETSKELDRASVRATLKVMQAAPSVDLLVTALRKAKVFVDSTAPTGGLALETKEAIDAVLSRND